MVFKVKKKNANKILDNIFVCIFLICLVFPILYLKENNIELQENRRISQLPSIFTKFGDLNYKYGNQLNNYISDRLFFRYQLIRLNKNIRYLLSVNLYQDGNTTYDKVNKVAYTPSFWGLTQIHQKEMHRIIKNLKHFNKYCQKKDIKLYLLFVPRRADFVKYNSFDIKKFNNSDTNRDKAVDLIGKIASESGIPVIFPYKEMKVENDKNPVYYKTDHHWSDSGAFIGYTELMKEISKTYHHVPILNKKDFNLGYSNNVKSVFNGKYNSGRLIRNSGLSDHYIEQFLNTKYLYFEHPDKSLRVFQEKSDITDFNPKTDVFFEYKKGYNKKVMLIGDSFTGALLKFLPYSFRQTLLLSDNRRGMYFNSYKSAIENYKPDIIIINMRTFYIGMFKNLEVNKGAKR